MLLWRNQPTHRPSQFLSSSSLSPRPLRDSIQISSSLAQMSQFSQQAPPSHKLGEAKHHLEKAGEKTFEAGKMAADQAKDAAKDVASKPKTGASEQQETTSIASTATPSTTTVTVTPSTASQAKSIEPTTVPLTAAAPTQIKEVAGTAQEKAKQVTETAQSQVKGLIARITEKLSPTSKSAPSLPVGTSGVTEAAQSAKESTKSTASKCSARLNSAIRSHPMLVGVGVPLLAFLLGLLLSALPIALLGHTAAHQSLVSRIVRGPKDLYSYPRGSFASHAHRQLDKAIKAQKQQQSGSMFGSLGLSSLSPFASHEDEEEPHSIFDSMMSHVPLVGSLRHFAHEDEDESSGLTQKAFKAYMAAQSGAKAAKGIKSWLPFTKSASRDEDESSRGWMHSMMGESHEDQDEAEDEDQDSWLQKGGKGLASSAFAAMPKMTGGKKSKGGILSLPLIGSKQKDTGRLSRQEERELQRLIEMASKKASKAN